MNHQKYSCQYQAYNGMVATVGSKLIIGTQHHLPTWLILRGDSSGDLNSCSWSFSCGTSLTLVPSSILFLNPDFLDDLAGQGSGLGYPSIQCPGDCIFGMVLHNVSNLVPSGYTSIVPIGRSVPFFCLQLAAAMSSLPFNSCKHAKTAWLWYALKGWRSSDVPKRWLSTCHEGSTTSVLHSAHHEHCSLSDISWFLVLISSAEFRTSLGGLEWDSCAAPYMLNVALEGQNISSNHKVWLIWMGVLTCLSFESVSLSLDTTAWLTVNQPLDLAKSVTTS